MAKTGYTAEDWERMLTAGAALAGPTMKAAVHLLTFTDLPRRPGFAALVDVEAGDGGEVAFVRNWRTVPGSPGADRLCSAHHRMLTLAASLAGGVPVDLREHASIGGHAHARRVAEAFLIAAGGHGLYTLTPTAELDQILADRDAFLAD